MPTLALQVAQELEDLGLHRDVQRRRRLVGDDQVGLGGDGAGDEDALGHAAGDLVRVGGEGALGVGDADAREQAERARLRLRSREAEGDPQRLEPAGGRWCKTGRGSTSAPAGRMRCVVRAVAAARRSSCRGGPCPSKRIAPATHVPPSGRSPRTDHAVCVLPEPDSPIRAWTSPRRTVSDTSSTTVFHPLLAWR